MNKISVVALLLIIILMTSGIGSCAGYSVDGVPKGGAELDKSPSLTSVLDWLWGAGAFLIDMSTFRVDNMPMFLSGVFLFMNLIGLFVLVLVVRGN